MLLVFISIIKKGNEVFVGSKGIWMREAKITGVSKKLIFHLTLGLVHIFHQKTSGILRNQGKIPTIRFFSVLIKFISKKKC